MRGVRIESGRWPRPALRRLLSDALVGLVAGALERVVGPDDRRAERFAGLAEAAGP